MGIIWYFLCYEALRRIKRNKASARPAQSLACDECSENVEGRGMFFFFLKLFSTFQFTVEAILLSPDGNIVIFQFVSFKDPNRLQLTEALRFGVKHQGSKYWQTI